MYILIEKMKTLLTISLNTFKLKKETFKCKSDSFKSDDTSACEQGFLKNKIKNISKKL